MASDTVGGTRARGRRRHLGRWLAVIAGMLAALLVAGYAAAGYVVYDTLTKGPVPCWNVDAANTPDHYTMRAGFDQAIADQNRMPAPQEVRFASRDPAVEGPVLAGWWIPSTTAGAPAVVVVHGILSCRREPNVLVPAGMLYRNGYSVLMLDLRDHGDSGGDADHRFAAGTDEYADVLGAWDWVVAQGIAPSKVGILGVSFGAANAVIAGAAEPSVPAVWADSAYTEMNRTLALYLESKGFPAWLGPGAAIWAHVVASDDLTAKSPLYEVDKYAGRHLAFIHGSDDPVLPAEMATQLHDRAVAAGAQVADVWVVSGAGHTEGVYRDPAGYEARLVAFFGEALAHGAG